MNSYPVEHKGMTNMGVRNAECGLRRGDLGVRNAECGFGNADWGMRSANCKSAVTKELPPSPRLPTSPRLRGTGRGTGCRAQSKISLAFTPKSVGSKIVNRPSSIVNFFTIVELLVVIAIIAILAAMLLPALKAAKDMAKKTVCANNLGQVGKATYSYLSDSNEWFPHRAMGGSGAASMLDDGDYVKANSGIWECPSASFTSYTYSYLKKSNGQYASIHLGWEECFGYPQGSVWEYKPRKLNAHIPFPYRTGFVGDMVGGSTYSTMWSYGTGYLSSADMKIDRRHSQGFNILFADSHTEYFKNVSNYQKYQVNTNWKEAGP